MLYKVILFMVLVLNLDAKSCKKYHSCLEVIKDFPNGDFRSKDRDKDGIPCENICHSKKEVDRLLKYIKVNNKKFR